MRMNLITTLSNPSVAGARTLPLSLTIRPACGVAGDYVFETNSAALLRLLDLKTDLPSSVIRRFKDDLEKLPKARLLGVELSENVLTEIGYFVD